MKQSIYKEDIKIIFNYFKVNPLKEIQILKINKTNNSYFICGSILYEPVIVKWTNKCKDFDIIVDLANEIKYFKNQELKFKLLDFEFYFNNGVIIPINNTFQNLLISV